MFVQDLVRAQAALCPDEVALVDEHERVTYRELCERAHRLAHALRGLGVGPEILVGVSCDRSVDMIVAVLGVLGAGGAYVPLDPTHPRARLSAMAAHAGIGVLLTRRACLDVPWPPELRVLCVDDPGALAGHPAEPPPPLGTPDNLAYVLYTSGSTGEPKGVMIPHRGVVDLAAAQIRRFGAGPGSRVLQLAPLGFDASVWEIVMALGAGAELHLAAADALLPGPGLVRLLAERQISHLTITPSVLAALPEAPLPDLGTIICAGDVCPPELAARWGRGRRFFNAYGPTEATVCATVHAFREGEQALPIGTPLEHAVVHLLDDDLAEVPEGVLGQIHLGGSGLARGYLGRPDLTAASFVPDPSRPGARLYRTGDLARALPDGSLAYAGRIDHQVKIRGNRVEPEEVQAHLSAHPAVREAVVGAGVDAAGGRALWAHVVPRAEPPSPAELRRFLAERLPRFMIPSAFVLVPDLPRTPSGKVDRRALPPPVRAARRHVPPRTPIGQALAEIWAATLHVEPIGEDDDLFELGGDSLSAARIAARIRDACGAEIDTAAVLEARTLGALAQRVAQSGGAPTSPGEARRTGATRAPLSFTQQRLWFLSQADPSSAAYHQPAGLHLRGPLDVEALRCALDELVRRHGALRTVFVLEGNAPTQEVAPAVPLPLTREDLSVFPLTVRAPKLAERVRVEVGRPFDLGRGPLLRALLLRVEDEAHLLVLTIHHLGADGASMRVLVRELAALYGARAAGREASLPPLPLTYADHALREREDLRAEALAGGIARWREELAGAPPVHAIPLDRPRPESPSSRGAQEGFAIPGAVRAALAAVGGAEGATLFMTLLAGLAVWLQAEGGRDDLVVGTPVMGRARGDLQDLVGCFAGTLAIRTTLGGDPTFREVVRRVRARALAAYALEHVPFEKVVEALHPARDARHHPLFQIMFALQPPPPEAQAGALSIRFSELDGGSAPFDLFVQLWEEHGRLAGTFTYATDLFERSSILRMIADLGGVLADVAESPDARLTALRLRSGRGAPPPDAGPIIEATLLSHPAVDDVAVRTRRTATGLDQRVALVASPAPVPAAILSAHLREHLPSWPHASAFVSVSALPLTADGQLDEAAVAAAIGAPATSSPSASAPRPPAHADGGPLLVPAGEPETLTQALLRAADGEGTITYIGADGAAVTERWASLLGRARRILGGLRRHGLRPGDVAILQVEALHLHFAAFWACVLGGVAPVTVAVAPSYERESGVSAKLRHAWALLGEPVILAGRALATPIDGLRALYPEMSRARVLPVEDLAEHPPAAEIHACHPEDVAFLQLTSGSTGTPKCIQETHRGIVRHVHGSAQHNGYGPGDVTLNWLPVDHVVPILTCHLKDVYLGCHEVQVAPGRVLGDPLSWLDLCEAHRVTHTWAPNFGFKLIADAVARRPDRSWDLSLVRAFLNAGEQVTLPVVADFLRALAPFGVRREAVVPSFGMAEACTCMTYANGFSPATGVHWVEKASLGGPLRFSSREAPGTLAFVDLGPPMPGVEIRVTDADNRVVPEGVVGRFQIKGGVITPGYLRNPPANAEAFVGDGWFNSGDLGFILGGRLTLTGREKEMIIVRGANFYCHEIEDVVNAVPGVVPTFAAACAVEDRAAGTEGLAVFFVPREPSERRAVAAAVRARVAESLGISPSSVVALGREDFPKTTSGKIQRSQLKRALAAGAVTDTLADAGAIDDSPGWFQRRVLSLRPLSGPEAPPRSGTVLIFADGLGLGERVREALAQRGRRCVIVQAGPAFAALGPDRLQIDPARPEDYGALLDALRDGGVDEILHAFTYDGAEAAGEDPGAQARGVYSLLFLVQALLRSPGASRPLRLTVVSSGAQATAPEEAAAADKALLVGVLLTIPQEIPWIDARHIDLPAASPEGEAALVLAEIRSARREREVAHRRGRRLVSRLMPAEVAPPAPPPFVDGGRYVITGGAGGIGTLVARHLLEHHRAHVILLDRTALAGAPARQERLSALSAIARTSGGEVVHDAADVADEAAVEGAITRAETRWGHPIDGVIHLAGVLGERLLADETRESFAATLRPKVAGSRTLARVLARRGGGLFVGFSSVNGALGGFAAGAYSAACRFQEAFTLEIGRGGDVRSHGFAWSAWAGTGMSAGSATRSAGAARRLGSLTPDEGMRSLIAGLGQGPGWWIVGLGRAAAAADATAAPVPPVAPGTAAEQVIAAIWREVLHTDDVGVTHNFFEVGGHSLLLAQVRVRLSAALGRDVPILDLFRHPTIRALARHLERSPEAERAADTGLEVADLRYRAQKQLAARARQRATAARGLRAPGKADDG